MAARERREDWLTPYRLRTVRIGVATTFSVVAALLLFAFLPGRPVLDRTPFLITIAVAALGGALVAVLPWRRLFRAGWGVRLMYAWSVADIALISGLILFGGAAGTELFFVYAFTIVFCAASYPRRGQLALLLLTFASYLGVQALQGWTIGAGDLLLRLGLLAALAYMADWLSNELRREMGGRFGAQRESERQARLLRIVANAGRRMSDLDSNRVLDTVIDSALALGFESGNFAFYGDDLLSYAVVHARGLPDEYATSIQSADIGMPALVRDARRTVLVDDYQNHPRSVPMLRELGYRAVIASPIWVQGRLTAALIAGTRAERAFTPEDVEAFELLASFASRAIDNAQRFERERQAVERFAQLDRLKGEFVSTVSHELRTPLTAILGMGLTLEHQWDQMEEGIRREFIQRVNANANALDEIVRTMLDFSRLDAGRMPLRRQRVRIDQLARQVVGRLSSLLGEHRVRLELDEAETEVDPPLMERVLENLVSNAVKHTPVGTTVTISTRIVHGEVLVEVADDGPGIAAEDIRHLGDRFFRGGDPNTRRTRGAGLGIALVNEILELHGSRLRIRSESGRGASFSFRVPIWTESADPSHSDSRSVAGLTRPG